MQTPPQTQHKVKGYGHSHHNSTKFSRTELIPVEEKAQSQDQKVLAFFLLYKLTEFTPCEVWQKMRSYGIISKLTPLTSVRRCITNLTKQEHLVKTTTKRDGLYGEPNFTWKVNTIKYNIAEQGKLFN